MLPTLTPPRLDPLGEPEQDDRLRVRTGELGTRCAVCETAQGAGVMPDGRLACEPCAKRKGARLSRR